MQTILPLLALFVALSPTLAAPSNGPLQAIPIPPESDTSGGDACMPELAALAMIEKMVQAMGKDADVLESAEEELRLQAADCLTDENDLTEASNRVLQRKGAVMRRGT